MSDDQTEIRDVGDTSLWVAHYRAEETERPDALFRDPYARKLCGERGRSIANDMQMMGKYTAWAVVNRTLIIDDFITQLIKEGIDTVLNLGAGLDSRPYRMNLPADLNWIEVDQPRIIQYKKSILQNEKPKCRLTQVELDLSDDKKRRDFLSSLTTSKKVLVITEGVLPYLNSEQVTKLAQELHQQPQFQFWITEYFNPKVYKHMKASWRQAKMRNAPFLFQPQDWMGFFEKLGWVTKELRYSSVEGVKHGRRPPMAWWGKFLVPLLPRRLKEEALKMTGYLLFQKK